ncbi:MAG: hypothetical protein HZA92_08630 [Verrucomicrobia bacterium]|nr:hypothetical protein [Verrucomicrobiota bacterium]
MTPTHINYPARSHRPLARLALATATCGLMLVAGEVALRLFAPMHLVGFPRAYEFDAELGVRAKPGVHALRTTDHQQELRVNRLGTVNFQEDFSGYRARLFALGDSYTQGTGLPADAVYPFQLDLLLNRDAAGRYERRVAVINLGLAANGGEQSLLILRRFIEKLGRPDVVLYLGAENDGSDDAMFLRGDRHRHLVDGSPRWGATLPLARWAAETEIGKRLRVAVKRPPTSSVPAGVRSGPSVAEQQRSVFERLKVQCRATNTTLVVGWAAAPSHSYDWLKSWAASNSVAFADWWPAVESTRASIPELPLHNPHSGGHLRPWVNRVIAEEFARQLEPQLSPTINSNSRGSTP